MRGLVIGVSAALAGCAVVPAPVTVAPPAPVVAPPVRPLTPFRLEGSAIQGGLLRGVAPEGAVRVVLESALGGPAPVAAPLAAGRFVVGFDRDAAPAATLVATLPDGRSVRESLIVAPRAWRIERIDAPLRAGRSDAAFDALRPAELAQIVAARAVDADADGWLAPLRWPARGRISGLFGAQRIYRGVPGSYHGGVDIALPTGTPVLAPAAGVVVLATAAPFTLEGNLLIVDHGGGLNSAFLHLSRIDVGVGDRVVAGQPIAAVGATGRATGAHLHWSLQWRGAKLDPLLVAGPMRAD